MNKKLCRSEAKALARELRKEGLTYGEICHRIGSRIPKGTMSGWCNDIELSAELKAKQREANLKHLDRVRGRALEVNRLKQERLIQSLKEKNQYLGRRFDVDTQKIALAMLYLGEGAKWKGHRGLSLGNSDPLVIKLYLSLLKMCYDIIPDSLACRVQCRADQDIEELENFWSEQLGIPRGKFRKACVDMRTLGKRTKRKDYMGVLMVTGGSTEIQRELHIICEILLQEQWAVGAAGSAPHWL